MTVTHDHHPLPGSKWIEGHGFALALIGCVGFWLAIILIVCLA